MSAEGMKRNSAREKLKEKVRSAMRVSINPRKLDRVYFALKSEGICSSRRDFARKAGLSSPTIDYLINNADNPDNINCTLETVQKLSQFVLKALAEEWNAEALVDDLLLDNTLLRRDLLDAIEGD